MKYHQDPNKALLEDIQPLLGCTDISIIALGTALASRAAEGFVPEWIGPAVRPGKNIEIDPYRVLSVRLYLSNGLYKNCQSTPIPNGRGHRGILKSAALGLFCNPEKKLNLFADLTPGHLIKMLEFLKEDRIHVELTYKPPHNLFLLSKVTYQSEDGVHTGESCMQDNYTRVIFLKKNGSTLYHAGSQIPNDDKQKDALKISELVKKLEYLSEDVYQKLEETVRVNTCAFEYGLRKGPGLGIGAKMYNLIQKRLIGEDIPNLAACNTAAAEDVRMAGENVPVMGITSSGSHGIAASVPIIVTARRMKKDRRKLLQSIALSFLITQKIDVLNGHLSVPCGCVTKASVGATAGIAYYLGGTVSQIEQAINSFMISSAGVICDGAKATCSLKLANAAYCACQSAFLALEGVKYNRGTGGIVREELRRNIENMARISTRMQNIDPVIVDILRSYDNRSVSEISNSPLKHSENLVREHRYRKN